MSTTHSDEDRDSIDRLAEEFVARFRKGERPSPGEYAARYPQWADEILELFPGLVFMEQFKPPADVHDGTPFDWSGPDLLSEQRTDPATEHATGPAPTIEQESGVGIPSGRDETLGYVIPPGHTTAPGTTTDGRPTEYGVSITKNRNPEGTTDSGTDGPQVPRVSPDIPGYQILDVLGRGGMGLVYKARHHALERVVALKVVLAGEHASDEQRTRFLTEAQAAARLIHPNIVQIYEIGEGDGLPYFSLEYVDGGSLEQKIKGQPQDPTWSATLLETLARAMHAAHRNGVIHRDLKPSNVLLTPEGLPKITDFGLAKRLESDSGLTRAGAIMGTPTYMAPEQAWGRKEEVGPHSDIYSMGAILYTLLTGRPPFQGVTPLETVAQVRTQEPVPPSRLRPKVPRDLETITLKCLQKEPRNRYATADALADDLRRFLERVPILARPVAAPERLWRLARRNPRVAALVGCVLSLLVAVAVISLTYAAILRQKNEELVNTSGRMQAARLEAAARASQVLDQNRKALEAWRTLGRLTLDELKALPGAQKLRQKFLDEVLQGLRNTSREMESLYRVYGQLENPRIAVFAMAGVDKLLGDELLEMDQVREALEHYRRMGTLVEEAAAAYPNDISIKVQLANNRAVLGYVSLNVLGEANTAKDYLREALELRRERLALEPDSDEAKLGAANSLGQLADCHQKLGDLNAAKDLFSEEVQVRDSLSQTAKREFEARRELSGLHEKLGALSLKLGDLPVARKNYGDSFAIREALAEEEPNHIKNLRDLNRSITAFGDVNLLELNDPSAAADYYQRALAGFYKLYELEPLPVLKADIAGGCYFLATALVRQGKIPQAEKLYQECLKIRSELAKKNPEDKISQINLIVAMARCGQHQEASSHARDLIKTSPGDSQISYQVACVLALCAGTTSDATLKGKYAHESIEAIRKAAAEGWKDVETLRIDPDLDAVRGDPNFQSLIQEIKAATKPSAVP